MNPPEINLNFALVCSPEGIIYQVIINSNPEIFDPMLDHNLKRFFEEGSRKKFYLFFQKILKDSQALEWELIFSISGTYLILQLFGYLSNDQILILASPNIVQADRLRQILLNEHTAVIKEWSKPLEKKFQQDQKQYTDVQSIDDISQLNNEIIILQRELVKKQVQLEKMNATIKAYSDGLEEMVAQRTQELKISEAKFRGIFESSSLGILIVHADGNILSTNQAFADLVGISINQIIDHSIQQFLFNQDKDSYELLFEQLLDTPGSSHQFEKEFIRKDGLRRWLEINFFLIDPGDDSQALAVNIVEDVTEKKTSQQALLQAEKLSAVGKIAASLAHEINNPLQAVMGNIGLAQESLPKDSPIRKKIEIATSELKRVSRIVADLREASRKPPLKEKQPEAIDEIIQKVITLTLKKCEEKSIFMKYEPQKIAPVLINNDQITQVLLNLVLNAIDAMPKGGNLFIFTDITEDPTGVSVFIKDEGTGLSEEIREHMFDPFFSTKQEGMGLGLYVSREIINTHKGKLHVVESNGKGTLIEMWLPSAETKEVKTS